MAKFDFSKLTEKFDLHGIMDNVKSIINPGSVIPENLDGDPIAAKLALIVAATHNMAQLHEQQEQEMSKINMLIASIFKDLEATKNTGSTSGTKEQSSEQEKK